MNFRRMSLSDSDASSTVASFCLSNAYAEALCSIISAGEGIPIECRFSYNRLNRSVLLTAPEDTEAATHIEFSEVAGQYILFDTVSLENKRAGTFTKFMRHLASIVAGTSVQYIEFQSVLTPEMRNWCTKYGFERVPSHTYDANGLGGGYRLYTKTMRLLGVGDC